MSESVAIPRRGGEEQALAVPPSAGCRFSLYPMTDDFASVIIDALAQASANVVDVATDDVSTYLAGAPEAMLRFVEQTVVAASRRTGHVVCTLLLSRGCPGEGPCQPAASASGRRSQLEPPPVARAGVPAAAHFSLYPLGVEGYMEIIEAEIGRVREAGLYAGAEHFTSRLEGDLAEVLAAIGQSWARSDASHVVAHATISVGSPTRRES